jgi:hypothetical protein
MRVQGGCESVFSHGKGLCHAGDEALKTEDIEHAGEIVA